MSLKKSITGLTFTHDINIRADYFTHNALDNLAYEMGNVMSRLERATITYCAPKLNPKSDPNKYLSDAHAP